MPTEERTEVMDEFENFRLLHLNLPGVPIEQLRSFRAFRQGGPTPPQVVDLAQGPTGPHFGGGGGSHSYGGPPDHQTPGYYGRGGPSYHGGGGQGRQRGPKRYEDEEGNTFSRVGEQGNLS